MNSSIEKLAIVIVTYKRQQLLDGLLDSLLFLEDAPWRVFIIDNEASSETEALVNIYSRLIEEGLTAAKWDDTQNALVYIPMAENSGGAGGFSRGVVEAYNQGAQWFWLMDDDVVAMPDAISNLSKWTNSFDAIQGARLDFDGGPFFWQYRFIEPLGIYNPVASSKPTKEGWKSANALCFEGALFSRRVVDTIGPPDSRFFVYWDDCIYGYRASKHFRIAAVDDVILRRARNVDNVEIGSVRQLNSTSDMTRYHIMRNRGHMANYMKLEGDYNPVTFAIGTALCACKEVIRLVAVDRKNIKSGVISLYSGWLDSQSILHDPSWTTVACVHCKRTCAVIP